MNTFFGTNRWCILIWTDTNMNRRHIIYLFIYFRTFAKKKTKKTKKTVKGSQCRLESCNKGPMPKQKGGGLYTVWRSYMKWTIMYEARWHEKILWAGTNKKVITACPGLKKKKTTTHSPTHICHWDQLCSFQCFQKYIEIELKKIKLPV